MKFRAGKTLGVAAAVAALAVSLPLAVTAGADPQTEPTTPVARIPDPQGPGCDDFKKAVPDWKSLNSGTVGPALAAIPEISTFNSLIAGGVNPGANIIPVLENGLYVVFAPSNEAFAAMPPAKLQALKESSVEELTRFGYYHVFLGLLGPDDVHGQRPTQDGALIKITGKGGDIEVNDTAKVVCGGIQARNAQIYIIDEVLDPDRAPGAPAATTAEPTEPTDAPETTEVSATAEAEPQDG